MAAGPSANHAAALANAEQQQVLHTLIQEAQQEIGRLRAELYSTSRLADERKQALDAMTAARDQLAAVAHQLEEKVQVMHSQLVQLPQLHHELKQLQEQQQQLEKDRAVQMQARRILESELQDERAARTAAEEARAKAEADRSRLQLGQDDQSAQVRLLRQKVAEAEEEQLRAEEEAAQLRQELAAQQQQLAAGLAADDSLDNRRGTSGSSRRAEEGLRAAQLEAQAAKADAVRLQQELREVKQQAQQTQQQLQELMQQQQQQQLHTSSHLQQPSTKESQQLSAELAACKAQIVSLQQALSAAREESSASRAEAERATTAARAAAAEAAAAAARRGHAQQAAAAVAPRDGGAGAEGDAEAEALQEQVELLMDKVVVLKKSRDKLLEQLDGQSVEMEQLLAEQQALTNSTAEARQHCAHWQAQTQDALLTISKLQELLAEAAAWRAPQQRPGSNAVGVTKEDDVDDVPNEDSGDAASEVDVGKLKSELLQQQVQVTALELQVKVLSAQLLRSHAACKQAGRTIVPLLSGVEGRLLALRARTGSLMA